MKKKYEKPLFLVEKYALTQQIAACTLQIGFNDFDCVFYDEDSTDAMKDVALGGGFAGDECWFPVSVGDEFDGVCYHTSVQSVFNS